MSEEKIELGDLAVDDITGYTGVAVCYGTYMSNCDRVALQPRKLKDDGSLQDALWFDLPQLKLLQKAVIPVPESPINKLKFEDEVQHTLSGYKGKVIGFNCWNNGCIRVGVQSPALHEGKPIDAEWFPLNDLRVVEEAAPEKYKNMKPGGPMPSSSMSRKVAR